MRGAEISFGQLAGQPQIGSAVVTQNLALAGVRKWRVKSFDRHLIFYLPLEGGVRIIRILHTAQDWWNLLELTQQG